MKYLKEKQKSLRFFLDYVDISKLRLLQLLNEEQEALAILKMIRAINSQFLERINTSFFKGEATYEEGVIAPINPKVNKLFFLVDAKDNDEYTEFIYKKLEEQLAGQITSNDVVITVGPRVNLICQRLELRIIQHFDYDLYLDPNKFIEKITTLIEVGLKNGVFDDVQLIVAQQNQDSRTIVAKKLFPFQRLDAEEETSSSGAPAAPPPPTAAAAPSGTAALAALMQSAERDYSAFFHDLDLRKINWFPNVRFFKYKFIKSIIKQNIVEITMIEKIQRLKLEIQLLDEKRNKLLDEAALVNRLLNRVRREKQTEATILLHAAFKLKAAGGDPWDDLIRKKREEDDWLTSKRGGAK